MPISFKVADHDANPLRESKGLGASQLLSSTWGWKSMSPSGPAQHGELLQSSFSGDQSTLDILSQNNGFVDTVIQAYNKHHHLILRPDDVWIAILGQFNFYVNANAEELRFKFVAHEGKKKLVVMAHGNRYSVDFGDLAHQMSNLIHDNVVDKDLKDWILPDFTTTSHNDTVICSVLMMSTLKAYFSYGIQLFCGIPSVTLEGEKSDWEKILDRLDKLSSFGTEPSVWANLLKPILKRFVSAFDGEADIDFWGKVCHHAYGGSGPGSISGWITAFCVWNSEGKWCGPNLTDNVQYGIINDNCIPVGFCEVDVELDDNGKKFDCIMVSGNMGTHVHGEKRDTISPLAAWFIFVKAAASESQDDNTQESWFEGGVDNI